MTLKVLVTAEAEEDFLVARSWYEANAPDQVVRLLGELDAVIERIRLFPSSFAPVYREARRVRLRVFPYQLWFRLLESRGVIEVVALVHVRQDRLGFVARLD